MHFLDQRIPTVARWLRSLNPSTVLGLCIGIIWYASYGWSTGQWMNPWLWLTSGIMATFLPTYSWGSNRVEEFLHAKTGAITAGRIGRFVCQLVFNLMLYVLSVKGGVIRPEYIVAVGGIFGAAAFTALASQGVQYLALLLAQRGLGNRDWNVLACLCVTVLFTALAMTGFPTIQAVFRYASLAFGGFMFVAGLIDDCRCFLRSPGSQQAS